MLFRAVLVYVNCGIKILNAFLGTSLMVQWLRVYSSNAGGTGLIPGWGSFACCGMWKKNLGILWVVWKINYIGSYQL